MGVRGLTSFIDENSSLYLKPFELYNSYLVIDGSSITYNLYHWSSKSHSAFAGDYDEYYKTVVDFFLMLKKCKVKPIVMFDGGYRLNKLKTALTRTYVRDFEKGYKNKHFCPLFMKNAFFDVMTDLKIFCVQCNMEADDELAAVARALKCPLLSYDSDFYIFDVMYIPFSTVYEEPVKFDDRNQYYVRCSIYNVENFLSQFSGFDKSLLPIAAMILGNDHISRSTFSNFYNNVIRKNIRVEKNKDFWNRIAKIQKNIVDKKKTTWKEIIHNQRIISSKKEVNDKYKNTEQNLKQESVSHQINYLEQESDTEENDDVVQESDTDQINGLEQESDTEQDDDVENITQQNNSLKQENVTDLIESLKQKTDTKQTEALKQKTATKQKKGLEQKVVTGKNKTLSNKAVNKEKIIGQKRGFIQKESIEKNKVVKKKTVLGQRKVIRQTDTLGQKLSLKKKKVNKPKKAPAPKLEIRPEVVIQETVVAKKKNIKLPKSIYSLREVAQKKTRSEEILTLFNWLRKESFESAVKKILCYIEKKDEERIFNSIITNIKFYTNSVVSKCVAEKLESELGFVGLRRKVFDIYMPGEIEQLFSQCKIHKIIMDIIVLCIYIPAVQIERGNRKSAHFAAFELIRSIYLLLFPFLKKKQPLKIYLSANYEYGFVEMNPDPLHFLSKLNLENILKDPLESRLSWLYRIVKIEKKDMDLFTRSDWSVFLMSVIYWIKVLNNEVKLVHIHALILMVIANQVIQKSVGYFRTHKKFMKSKGHLLKKLKKTPIEVGKSTDFNGMLESVTLYEKLLIHSELMPYRAVSEEITKECYDLSAVHLFSCFQSCLFHIMQLNALLNYPLPYLKISDFYSGTILFNFYSVINYFLLKNKCSVENFGRNLFKNTPNLAKLYAFLSQNLCKYSKCSPPVVNKRKKKKKKKNKSSDKNEDSEDEIICNEVNDNEDDDYSDDNNPYAVLKDAGF